MKEMEMQFCLCSLVRCLQTDSWRIVSAGDDKTLKVRLPGESGDLKFSLHIHSILFGFTQPDRKHFYYK